MPGQVVQFPHRQVERPITYRQLAGELGCSKRFLQERVREGMPDEGLDYLGRRVFLASRVRAWLDGRQVRMGRTA